MLSLTCVLFNTIKQYIIMKNNYLLIIKKALNCTL
jgi:hypothetical protein